MQGFHRSLLFPLFLSLPTFPYFFDKIPSFPYFIPTFLAHGEKNIYTCCTMVPSASIQIYPVDGRVLIERQGAIFMLKSVSDVILLQDMSLLSIFKENRAKRLLIMHTKSCHAPPVEIILTLFFPRNRPRYFSVLHPNFRWKAGGSPAI